MNRVETPLFIGTTIAVMTFVGCNDARWRDASAVRQTRITEGLKQYSAHDAAGPERIKETLEIDRRMAKHHSDNLDYTTDLFRRLHERDVRRWYDEAPDREAMLRELWNAHPETIPDTWARMVY